MTMQLKTTGVITSVDVKRHATSLTIDVRMMGTTVDELKTLIGTVVSLAVDDRQSRLYT